MKINSKYGGFEKDELAKDILNLYCKTKYSSIEAVYLKIAQTAKEPFPKWLRDNEGKLRKKVNEPDVLYSLFTLIDIYDTLGASPEFYRRDIMGKFNDDRTTAEKVAYFLPTVMAMGDLVGGFDILAPYANIINLICSEDITGIDVKDASAIEQDLTTITEAYYGTDTRVGLPPEKSKNASKTRKQMFLLLLDRFSKELSSIAGSQGLPEFSKALLNGLLVMPIPNGIGKYINMNYTSLSSANLAKKIASQILNYPDEKYFMQHYDLINLEAMSKAGVMTEEDAYSFKEVFETNKDMVDISGVAGDGKDRLLPDDKLPKDSRLNPEYLMVVSLIFYFMQQKTKSSPSVFAS